MKLITDYYRGQNAKLHENPKYGKGGARHINTVRKLRNEYRCETVLDYGCGKATLSESATFPVVNYDPAIFEYSRNPPKCDLVVCTDVMEHVEPDLLENVLNHIWTVTGKCAYFCIATRKDSTKTLPDGTNPHKIVQEPYWWSSKLKRIFTIRDMQILKGEVRFICTP